MEAADTRPRRRPRGALIWAWPLALAAVAPLLLAASADASLHTQALVGAAAIAAAVGLSLVRHRIANLALIALSLAMSARYLFWRGAETLAFETALEQTLGIGLFLAEAFAALVLLLGFLQTVRPLRRKPVPLPRDVTAWPSVDVLIPTYDENLDVVGPSILAAVQMDYPRDRLKVVVLDDGDRPEVAAFARAAGAEYLAREDCAGAKAGNLNHGLARSEADLVAVFDADHAPNRAFLQMTAGAFLADSGLAVVQTPHGYFTADPVERATPAGAGVPNQDMLFHDVVQDGADLWNATFFAGSAAVLRRSALADVGGFAEETLTEDAHTALRLHRRGWRSAFLPVTLSAGLATDRLAAHLAQRERWARGMTQIFRLENPLSGSGLTLAQRFCYLNAMLHFLAPLPRLVFLVAPIMFLGFGLTVIAADWKLLLAFASPHLAVALLATFRLQRRRRAAFWGGVYESVTAFRLLRPVVATLFDPSPRAFRVTPKSAHGDGGRARALAAPHVVLCLALAAALALGAARLAAGEAGVLTFGPAAAGALGLNMAWALANLLVVLAAVAAARRPRHDRGFAAVPADLAVEARTSGARMLKGRSIDLAMGEALLRLDDADGLAVGDAVDLTFSLGAEQIAIAGVAAGKAGARVRVRFDTSDIKTQRAATRLVFGRADAWLEKDRARGPTVLGSFWRLLRLAGGAFRPARPRAAVVALALAATTLAAALHGDARAEEGAQPAPPAATAVWTPVDPRRSVSLAAYGAPTRMRMSTARDARTLTLDLPAHVAVQTATLRLRYSHSPALASNLSAIAVYLNDVPIGQTALSPAAAAAGALDLPIPTNLLKRRNLLRIETNMRLGDACGDLFDKALWLDLDAANSTLEFSVAPETPTNDLANLPLPFLDPSAVATEILTFALPPNPSDKTLAAAGVVASYFGAAAGGRDVRIAVRFAGLGAGDTVLFASGETGPDGVELHGAAGADQIAVVANPLYAAGAKVLAITAADDDGLLTTARHFALGALGGSLSGDVAAASGAPSLAVRRPDDAQRWLPIDRPVRIADIVSDPARLSGAGLKGEVAARFVLPPGDYGVGGHGPVLDLEFAYPALAAVDPARARLDVTLNGASLAVLPLGPEAARRAAVAASDSAGGSTGHAAIRIDAATLRPGENAFRFDFALPPPAGDCAGAPGDLPYAVSPSSTIDFAAVPRRVLQPDLGAFAALGYPFTRMADLSETVIALPRAIDADTAAAFLETMAHFGAATGEVAAAVTVVRVDGLAAHADKHALVIGPWSETRAAVAGWGGGGPFLFGEDGLTVAAVSGGELASAGQGGEAGASFESGVTQASITVGDALDGVVGFERPDAPGRSVVLAFGRNSARTLDHVRRILAADSKAAVGADTVRFAGGEMQNWRLGPRFALVEPDGLASLRWRLGQRPLLLGALLVVGVVFLTAALAWMLRRIAAARLADMNDV